MESEGKTINLGVIGFGQRAQGLWWHISNLSKNVVLYAVFDRDERSIEKAKKQNPNIKVCKTLKEICEDKEVPWLLIGTWNNFHKEQVLEAFKNGKHVFCEKPLASTLEDSIIMRNAWLKVKDKCKFVIGFVLRFTNFYRKIREIVCEKKLIGDIISLEFNETLHWNHGGFIFGDWRRLEEPSGGMLLEKCCHDIDLINWIVGSKVRILFKKNDLQAKKVSSFGGRNFFVPKNEHMLEEVGYNAFRTWGGYIMVNPFGGDTDIVDNQVAIIEFENGVRATFHLNACTSIQERRMYICGSKGTLRGDLLTGKIQHKKIQNFSDDEWEGGRVWAGGHGGKQNIFKLLFQDGDPVICQSLIDAMFEGKDPQCGIEEGLDSALLCLGMDMARKQNCVLDMGEIWKIKEQQ